MKKVSVILSSKIYFKNTLKWYFSSVNVLLDPRAILFTKDAKLRRCGVRPEILHFKEIQVKRTNGNHIWSVCCPIGSHMLHVVTEHLKMPY